MISKLWHWLFGGCPHDGGWSRVRYGNVVDYRKDVVGYYEISKCNKCGKLKEYQV